MINSRDIHDLTPDTADYSFAGVETASVGLQLNRSILHRIVASLIPTSFAQSEMQRVFPLEVISRVLLVFFACWLYVAHSQFSGEYPRSLSILSMDSPEGHSPISAKKFSKDSAHLLQTVMPIPPYLLYASSSLFVQRVSIPDQMP